MQLGFIGTGEITSSIVTGLCSSGGSPHSIRLSPRNRAVAEELANRFNGISIASCNQEVLDHCDTIVVAVRPAIARSVLSELRFRPDHLVISLVSALTVRSVSDLAAPVVRITRAVPLPSTAARLSPTAIYTHPVRPRVTSSLRSELCLLLKVRKSSTQCVQRLRLLRPI